MDRIWFHIRTVQDAPCSSRKCFRNRRYGSPGSRFGSCCKDCSCTPRQPKRTPKPGTRLSSSRYLKNKVKFPIEWILRLKFSTL